MTRKSVYSYLFICLFATFSNTLLAKPDNDKLSYAPLFHLYLEDLSNIDVITLPKIEESLSQFVGIVSLRFLTIGMTVSL